MNSHFLYVLASFVLCGCGIGLKVGLDKTPSAAFSAIAIETPLADGRAKTVRVSIFSHEGTPIAGLTPTLATTGFRNTLVQSCLPSNSDGVSVCPGAIASSVAETKTLSVTAPFFLQKAVAFPPAKRGYTARRCGFDLNRNGIRGEAADCRVCDGKTTDPDGDGVNEDLIYVDSGLGNDGTGTGAPTLPFRTIAAAFAAANGPGVGGEDIMCLSGTFNETLSLTLGGMAGTYSIDGMQYPKHPLMLVGWDKDGDGIYPPVDTDDVAVIDGQNNFAFFLQIPGALDSFEMAHLTVKRFRDPAATGGGFLYMPGTFSRRWISFHDIEFDGINDGMVDNNVSPDRAAFFGQASYLSVVNTLMTQTGATLWNQFTANYGTYGHILVEYMTLKSNTPADGAEIFVLRGLDDFTVRKSDFEALLPAGWDFLTPYSDYYIWMSLRGCCTRFTLSENNISGFSQALAVGFQSGAACTPPTNYDDIVFDSNRVLDPFARTDMVDISNALAGGAADTATNTVDDVMISNNFLAYTGTGMADGCIWLHPGNSASATGGTVTLVGNTCIGPFLYAAYSTQNYPGVTFPNQNFRVFNNIFDLQNPAAHYAVFSTTPSGIQSDGNVFVPPSVGWMWGGATTADLATWQVNRSMELTSRVCVPEFVDTLGRDYHLASADSCARSAGVDISAYTTRDFDGDSRPAASDVGADQTVH